MRLGYALAAVLAAHIFLMVWLEKLPVLDAAWLTITTATTVGYGDISAQTVGGRVATVLLLYIAGIAILAQTAAMYFEYRQDTRLRMLTGDWSWQMNDHIVFLNSPNAKGSDYFLKAMTALRESATGPAGQPVIIVSDNLPDRIPDRLRKLDVVFVNGGPTDPQSLAAASISKASTIVILAAQSEDRDADSVTFDLVHRLRENGCTARIIAEVVADDNRKRMLGAGADNVLRPIRIYPELLVRAIISPGAERIAEDLFDSKGEECIRYDVRAKASWGAIVKLMVDNDVGTPLGYLTTDNAVISNARPTDKVTAEALFLIVRQGNLKSTDDVRALVDRAF
ncbi:MAG: ion channel [Sphingomonadales bacterium]